MYTLILYTGVCPLYLSKSGENSIKMILEATESSYQKAQVLNFKKYDDKLS